MTRKQDRRKMEFIMYYQLLESQGYKIAGTLKCIEAEDGMEIQNAHYGTD